MAEGKEMATLEYCIKLRFHWLPKTSISSLRAPLTADILNNSPRPLFVEFDKIQDEFQAACGRAIDTGEIITIWADKREDFPSMEILKLQWLAYLMHRLAGGADPHVYEPPFPDSDDLDAAKYLRSRPAPTSSILGATGRYDFLDDDWSIRRDIIQDIHRLLQANTALLKKENRGDVAKPGDNSRPVMFSSRDLINQARFWAALWSLERPRLDAIHRSLLANEDGFPGDLMESLGMVHEFVWWFTRVPSGNRDTTVPRIDTQIEEANSRRAGGKCCITGRDDAERCYIIPSWTLMRPERSKCLILHMGGLFGAEAMDHLRRLVRDRINTARNIIYLSRELQKLWDQGVFALKPLGYDSRPKGREAGASVEHLDKQDLEHCLKLRFQWLPKTSVQNLRETASPDLLSTSPRDLIQEFEMNEELQADIGRRINSGETITIWADRREDLPAIGFLRVRWLACLIHRFTGGADPKIYEPPFPGSDDIYAIGSMLRDAAELRRLRKRLADLEPRIKNRMADV
ncbi:Integral membrane protein [Colletotrichum asianum]